MRNAGLLIKTYLVGAFKEKMFMKIAQASKDSSHPTKALKESRTLQHVEQALQVLVSEVGVLLAPARGNSLTLTDTISSLSGPQSRLRRPLRAWCCLDSRKNSATISALPRKVMPCSRVCCFAIGQSGGRTRAPGANPRCLFLCFRRSSRHLVQNPTPLPSRLARVQTEHGAREFFPPTSLLRLRTRGGARNGIGFLVRRTTDSRPPTRST